MSRMVIAGGTGMIGRRLVAALLQDGVEVTVLSRTPERAGLPAGVSVQPWTDLAGTLAGAGAVINLCGAGIADRRWSAARKRELLDSRLQPTNLLVAALRGLDPAPALINASAIGFYGPRDGQVVTEASGSGPGFLAKLCRQWEAAADAAAAGQVRVVRVRIGIVLAREGGALGKMAQPVRMFAGTRLGHGQQGLSWIHLDDLVGLFLEAARNPAYAGAVNATAPMPTSNETFTRALARCLHRPLLPVPALLTRTALRDLLGEMGQELLLEGAFVYPRKAQELGFRFRFEELAPALRDLLRN